MWQMGHLGLLSWALPNGKLMLVGVHIISTQEWKPLWQHQSGHDRRQNCMTNACSMD